MFADKFNEHKYKDDILKKFETEVPIKDIQSWLTELGEEYKLSGDTLRRHKKRHLDGVAVNEEVEKAKDEHGEGSEIEDMLLETIGQCRARKRNTTMSGKDFQYYDQQMQNAIKLLTEMRGSGEKKMTVAEVFKKLGEGIDDEGTEATGTDN